MKWSSLGQQLELEFNCLVTQSSIQMKNMLFSCDPLIIIYRFSDNHLLSPTSGVWCRQKTFNNNQCTSTLEMLMRYSSLSYNLAKNLVVCWILIISFIKRLYVEHYIYYTLSHKKIPDLRNEIPFQILGIVSI